MQKSADAFRTISEVADLLDVPQHVLRFWETKFSQIKPLKRGGGRRYYRPNDVKLIRGIQHLLYTDGYTIKGVQKLIRDQGIRFVVDTGRVGQDDLAAFSGEVQINPLAGKSELPIANQVAAKPKAPVSRPIIQEPKPEKTKIGLSEDQKRVLTDVLNDLVALKAKLVSVRAANAIEAVEGTRFHHATRSA